MDGGEPSYHIAREDHRVPGQVSLWHRPRAPCPRPSIATDDAVVDIEKKLVRGMVGKGTKIPNATGLLPKDERPVVGENTTISL